MSISTVSRKGSVARLVPAVVAVAAMSCAARDHTIQTVAAAPADAPSDELATQACLGDAPAQVLSLKSAQNVPFQLAYFRGCGWKYVAGPQRIDSFTSESHQAQGYTTTAANVPVPVDEVLTVFIDGPTGYTFVWARDAGWKFVGKMAGETP